MNVRDAAYVASRLAGVPYHRAAAAFRSAARSVSAGRGVRITYSPGADVVSIDAEAPEIWDEVWSEAKSLILRDARRTA